MNVQLTAVLMLGPLRSDRTMQTIKRDVSILIVVVAVVVVVVVVVIVVVVVVVA